MNTILFDLDGTLLPFNMDLFTQIYFREVSSHFADLMNGKDLVRHIQSSIHTTVNNLDYRTNEDVFMEAFKSGISGDLDVYRQRFDSFYETKFLKLKECTLDIPVIKDSVRLLKSKGYNLVVATNPIFPLKAIEHRIRWAGFDPKDFIYISSYEQNHYCKPQIKFYAELLNDIGKNPEECLMVGNDVQEDLIAEKLGIKTFLIENYVIHRTEEMVCPDYSGSYEDFYKFVKELPVLY